MHILKKAVIHSRENIKVVFHSREKYNLYFTGEFGCPLLS